MSDLQEIRDELTLMRESMLVLAGRQEVILRRASGAVPVTHLWLHRVIKDLETNPDTQYRVHLYGVIYWLINFPLVAWLFFGYPSQWLKWGVFITLMYSIYANFATDYGGMSAALAIKGASPLPPIPAQPGD